MTVVDSSGWIEYFGDGPKASKYEKAILDQDNLLVPSICVYEVAKWLLSHSDNSQLVEEAVGGMRLGSVVPLDEGLALHAAEISATHGLAMVDSIILATAWTYEALLLTQDADFKGKTGVEYIS